MFWATMALPRESAHALCIPCHPWDRTNLNLQGLQFQTPCSWESCLFPWASLLADRQCPQSHGPPRSPHVGTLAFQKSYWGSPPTPKPLQCDLSCVSQPPKPHLATDAAVWGQHDTCPCPPELRSQSTPSVTWHTVQSKETARHTLNGVSWGDSSSFAKSRLRDEINTCDERRATALDPG